MNKNRLFISLITVLIYEILMVLVHPEGLSFIKILITVLIWISFYLSVSTFTQLYKSTRENLPGYAIIIFLILILWNIVNIFRGIISDDTIATILGNKGTSLALLVPFSLVFGINEINLKTINMFFIGLIIIGLPAFFLFFAFSGETGNYIYNQAFQVLISGTVFLITITPFQTIKNKLLIFLGSILLFYLAIKTEDRAMMLRIFMLYFSLIAIYLYKKFNFKWILILAFFSLLIPFFLLYKSIISGQSALEYYLSKINDQKLSDDTRTFIYIEVFEDLSRNNELIIGKGSNARYYSPYFAEAEGDSSLRLSIEVGILAILLKGGFIAVLLNLTFLFIAIYLSFFRTNNYFVVGIGFILLVHTLLLFIENILEYSTYNFTIWLLIGVCLSKKIRTFNNIEIKNALLYGNSIS